MRHYLISFNSFLPVSLLYKTIVTEFAFLGLIGAQGPFYLLAILIILSQGCLIQILPLFLYYHC